MSAPRMNGERTRGGAFPVDAHAAEVGHLKDNIAALLRVHGEMEEELRRANAKLEGMGKALAGVSVQRDEWKERYHAVARVLADLKPSRGPADGR